MRPAITLTLIALLFVIFGAALIQFVVLAR